jgi:hypothetical protein
MFGIRVELLYQWREPVTVPFYEKGNKTGCEIRLD